MSIEDFAEAHKDLHRVPDYEPRRPKKAVVGKTSTKGTSMEAVMIPARTVVHIGGIPVYLATDTIVETAHGNMSLLTGYHYAHLTSHPASAPQRPDENER